MVDVKENALRMRREGMPRFMVAKKSGTTEAQIAEWEREDEEVRSRHPVLSLLHEGKTPAEIGKALGCSAEEARRRVVAAWKKEKDDFTAASIHRAVWGE